VTESTAAAPRPSFWQRRLLGPLRAQLTQGVTPDRVVSVRGMADRSPKIVDFPLDPRNRRISVLLPFRTQGPGGPGGPEQTPSDVASAPVP